MEKVIINFNEDDLEGNYPELIFDSVKYHLFGDRNIEYIFPQIQKGGITLKKRVAKELEKLDIKGEYNVGFVTTKTQEAVFKIIITQ